MKKRYYGLLGIDDKNTKRMVRSICDAVSKANAPLATSIVLGTMYVETDNGYTKDKFTKNGIGATQIDKIAFYDIVKRTPLKIKKLVLQNLQVNISTVKYRSLEHNAFLAFLFTRLKYYLVPHELDYYPPDKMWKVFYNSSLGAGKRSDFIQKYKRYFR